MTTVEKQSLYKHYRTIGYSHIDAIRKVNADSRLRSILTRLEL